MALIPTGLQDDIVNILTSPSGDLPLMWSEAIGGFTSTIIPPILPTLLDAAEALLKTSLIPALERPTSESPDLASAVWNASMATFAAAVGAGMMASTPGAYVAMIPPPVPFFTVVFETLVETDSADVAAADMAIKIYAWFMTGTITPTGASPIPWT